MNKLETLSNTLLSADSEDNFLCQPSSEAENRTGYEEFKSTERGQAAIAENVYTKESLAQRLNQARKSTNPLYHAAQPLLRTLSEVPSSVEHLESVDTLNTWLKREVAFFTQLCEQLDIPWRKMAIVRYCLCTALDEAIHTTTWGVESGWSQHNLLNYFEEDNDGGNKFFLLTGRLAMSPAEYHDVLFILLHILNLGFEGRYSIQQDGQQQLVQIRQQLYQLVMAHSPSFPKRLSPHGILDFPPRTAPPKRLSARITILLFLLLTVGCFMFYRFQLKQQVAGLEARLLLLTQQLTISPLPRLTLTLPMLLQQEIEADLIALEPIENGFRIRLLTDIVFPSGSSEPVVQQQPIIERIANAVQQVNATITVEGHSDSQPFQRKKQTTNQQLSLQRASTVARYFRAAGVDNKKIHVTGVGDSQPLVPNLTQQQRDKNRRVEFVVTL